MLDNLMEVNPVAIGLTIILYILCMLVLWKGVGGWEVRDQILISVAALPIIYFAVSYQINK